MQALSSPFWASFIKSPSSCRNWDWICVHIFQDRTKTTETKRRTQTPVQRWLPLGNLQGPLQGSGLSPGWWAPWLKPGTGQGGHFARVSMVVLTLAPSMLLKEFLSADSHSLSFLPYYFIYFLNCKGSSWLAQRGLPAFNRLPDEVRGDITFQKTTRDLKKLAGFIWMLPHPNIMQAARNLRR